MAPTITITTTTHPLVELRAARAEVLAAVRGYRMPDLLRPGMDGEWSGRDVLLHMAAWLRELMTLVPDLAAHDHERGAPSLCVVQPRATVDWTSWNGDHGQAHHDARPEAALAGFVTAHARLLDRVAMIDEAGLRRHGTTRWGSTTSGWDLLRAEAAHERVHAARLAQRGSRVGCGAGIPGECSPASGSLLRAS